MNLFDLFEGAIDDLEARRIENLEAKMDDLTARAKQTNDPKVKEALRHEFAKAKAERDSYYKLNVEEETDTNYTYTVFIDGTKEGTYGSKEEAKEVVRRKKEQAPGRDYRIKPKARTSMASIKRFQRNRDRNIDEHGGGGVGPRQWHNYVKAHRTDEDDLIKVEGWQDFNKVEPYEVCLAGKPVKQFDYYEDARRFHDNWKKKLYNQGEKEKADKITLNPIMKEAVSKNDLLKQVGDKLNDPEFRKQPSDPTKRWEKGDLYQGPGPDDYGYTGYQGHGMPRDNPKKKKGVAEAGSPAQQAAIAIAMKKAGKKPKQVDEDYGSWIVYDPETKQIKKRFKTHTAGKSYAKVHGLGFASSEYYFDNVKEPAVTEGIVASGPSKPLDDKAVRKIVWDTLKINADTGEQALERALAYLAKKPQSRMVQDLQDKFQSLSDRLAQGLPEASMNWASHNPTGPKFGGYLKGTDPAPTEFSKKSFGAESEEMEEGIEGNMTARSNPLTQPLRKRQHMNRNTQVSLGKHNNNLKAAAARGLGEMTDDDIAKLRADADAGIKSSIDKQSDARIAALKNPPKEKSFMQKVGDKQIGMVKGAWKGLTGKLEESDNFMTWAVRNGYNFTKDPAIYESARNEYKALVESKKKTLKNTNEDCGPIAPHETYYGAMDEAKGLGKRVRVVSGPAAGQTGTIGEVRNGAYQGAPKYYTVDLDNGGHVQVRKEALKLIKDDLEESLKDGEYFIWTVYFDNGTSKRIKVKSDEFDPYAYYARKNQVVVNVDYNWEIHQ